jgi:hypothetical protein
MIEPSNTNDGQPVKKARLLVTDCPSALSSTLLDHHVLSKRNLTASIEAMKSPALAEVQSFIVDIYKEIGIDGSKSILATASSTDIMLQKEMTLASASKMMTQTRTTMWTTTTRPITKNHANSTIPVDVDFRVYKHQN